jgi:hypothetical protein
VADKAIFRKERLDSRFEERAGVLLAAEGKRAGEQDQKDDPNSECGLNHSLLPWRVGC